MHEAAIIIHIHQSQLSHEIHSTSLIGIPAKVNEPPILGTIGEKIYLNNNPSLPPGDIPVLENEANIHHAIGFSETIGNISHPSMARRCCSPPVPLINGHQGHDAVQGSEGKHTQSADLHQGHSHFTYCHDCTDEK
jgi:hypothetical protein